MSVKTTVFALADQPVLIALDWGTSSLRAYLLDAQGQVAVQREAPWGILQLPAPAREGGFDQALASVAGDWLARWPQLPMLAGGMVGSAQGWREVPYVPCPADLQTLAGQLVRVQTRLGTDLHIVSGVLQPGHAGGTGRGQTPDVMRGEEVQIVGAISGHPDWAAKSRMVLPGTHSKWATVESGTIVRFTTSMAGELFAVLRQQSILGRLMPKDALASHPEGFARGLATGWHAGPGELITRLFSTRSLGLTGEVPPEALADYLSGILIGSELAAMLRNASGQKGEARSVDEHGAPLILIGSPELTARYALALGTVGVTPAAVLDNTAPQGLWQIACAAGLIQQEGGSREP